MILTLLTAAPLAAAAGAQGGGSFGEDDAYARAAGAFPWLYVSAVDASFSGVDAYDRAADDNPARPMYAASSCFSGDDAYDAAAGGNPGLAATAAGNSEDAIARDPAALAIAGAYSGDDAYDPAAGGSPDGSPIVMACALDSDSAFNQSLLQNCGIRYDVKASSQTVSTRPLQVRNTRSVFLRTAYENRHSASPR